MDPDLAGEVDKISSRGEKGDKSKLINKAIRSLLEEYGVIEKNNIVRFY
jgi:metal-responsive CopG/Arc/MetJ family transcriptional regulator